MDTVTHVRTILISRFQVHPTELNLKVLVQTKLEDTAGGGSTVSGHYLLTGWLNSHLPKVLHVRHERLFSVNDDMHSNLLQSNFETICSDLSILKFIKNKVYLKAMCIIIYFWDQKKIPLLFAFAWLWKK